jgi:hypothetical protein
MHGDHEFKGSLGYQQVPVWKKNRELRLNKKGHKEKEFQNLNSQQMQASDKVQRNNS